MTWEDDCGDDDVCPECGGRLVYQCISCDADGSRQEWGYICDSCVALFI